MSRPVLGVVCCTRTVGIEPAQAVMNRYLLGALTYADVAVLMVPSLPDLMSALDVADRLDGLLLTGSPSNIEADRYGADPAQSVGPFDAGRDQMSIDLIAAMAARQRPVFGICRGLQEINVALGGTLRRDMSVPGASLPHHAPDDAGFAEMFDHRHPVSLRADGPLARAFGAQQIEVNSVHYQGIDRLADRLVIEAQAPDGVVEAVSADLDGAPLLAVQWHPEWQTAADPNSQAFFRLLGQALRN